MTDKQIIINGVDVSGCEHRCDTHKTLLADGHIMEFENYCQITNDGCYAINCYYKQLKRKEQECEELKAELELFKTSNQTTIDQLKAENKELKEKYELLLDNFLINFYTGLDEKYDKLEQELQAKETKCEELKKELEAAKGLAKIRCQCLEAIKELANNANLPNISLYIDSFLNKTFNKDENCHFDKIKELTKEM